MAGELGDAKEMAAKSAWPYPNESADYRAARTALLAEEIELRRHIERVAEMRRALPPGGAVTGDYRFGSAQGQVGLADMFGAKPTLITYSWMFGPERERPCPMCTNFLSALNGIAPDLEQNVAVAVIARSPVERMAAFARERGWRHLNFYSDPTGAYSRDYHALLGEKDDIPALNVFSRKDGTIRLFYGGEMGPEAADAGQDPRGAPDLSPLWNLLDMTPEGRRPDWYPKLDY
jgi:predicted dithiol-disulfide oxidoreductase (DUF899 family)